MDLLTIEHAVNNSKELEEGDLSSILTAVAAKGYSGVSKA